MFAYSKLTCPDQAGLSSLYNKYQTGFMSGHFLSCQSDYSNLCLYQFTFLGSLRPIDWIWILVLFS